MSVHFVFVQANSHLCLKLKLYLEKNQSFCSTEQSGCCHRLVLTLVVKVGLGKCCRV